MDCPICYEQITTSTGQVTTSCGHTFHFKCLNEWYYHQIQEEEGVETCPCCRKEPGEFERASLVEDGTEIDAESETLSEVSVPNETGREWIRVGPRRWIIPSSSEHRLQILAQIAAEQQKENELRIPPYNGEAHALWILRNLFEAPMEPAGPMETISPVDRTKMFRRRRRGMLPGRDFWSHLGIEYDLKEINGYMTD